MEARYIIACAALLAVVAGFAGPEATPTRLPEDPAVPAEIPAGSSLGPVQARGIYGRLDKNRNGLISRREGQAHTALTRRWDAADVNKDGAVDTAEFAAFEATGPLFPQ